MEENNEPLIKENIDGIEEIFSIFLWKQNINNRQIWQCWKKELSL